MATKRELESLLIEARKFHNQVGNNADKLAIWHIRVDRALKGVEGDDPQERYDDPELLEHRKFVDRLFRR